MATEPRTFTHLTEVETALQAYWPVRTGRPVYTLDTMERLMETLGDPQDSLRVIHVAGTSGKTSTCYYLASLLQAAGQRVGMTVSPHIMSLNERVQIDLQPLAEARFCADFSSFLGLVEASGLPVQYFELLTAFAYWEFARLGVDVAVVEVGVGGLLDPTNVARRADKLCVITDIGLDHRQLLGDTLGEIASQKAGIIQLHNTVLCYRQGEEVMTAIRARAAQQLGELHVISAHIPAAVPEALPAFQRRNAGLALAAAKVYTERAGLQLPHPSGLGPALAVAVPGRMEMFRSRERPVVIDGAHNPQKLQTFMASLSARFPDLPIAAVVGFSRNHAADAVESLAPLMAQGVHIIITPFGSSPYDPARSASADDIAARLAESGYTRYETAASPEAAWQTLLARPEPLLVATGSLYLLQYIRPLAWHDCELFNSAA